MKGVKLRCERGRTANPTQRTTQRTSYPHRPRCTRATRPKSHDAAHSRLAIHRPRIPTSSHTAVLAPEILAYGILAHDRRHTAHSLIAFRMDQTGIPGVLWLQHTRNSISTYSDKNASMDRDYLSNKRYCYLYEVDPSGLNIITRHHIIPKRRRKFQYFLLMTVITLLGFLSISHLSLSVSIIMTFIGISSCISLYKHSIKKETVIVMPSFGVQLETHYTSGKIDRYFVPIGDILAAVINEAVTPFTCYSYLALILRDQSELMMVFQVLWPPLEILIPTWKSLCTAIDHNSKPSGD